MSCDYHVITVDGRVVIIMLLNVQEFVMYDHKLDPHGLQYSID